MAEPARLQHTFAALQRPLRSEAEDRLADRIAAAALKDAGILKESISQRDWGIQ